MFVCSSSKQIWQIAGSGGEAGSESFAREADSAAERRVVRLFATADTIDLAREPEGRADDEDATGGGGGAKAIPAFTFSSDGVSMYFSISFSLFHSM